MRLLSTTLILFFVCNISYSQQIGSYDFTGFLTTSQGQVISFKLMLNEIKDGSFKGYSVTNYDGEDYTKSIIEGKIDLIGKTLSFKEISNSETKSTAEDSIFCYITASHLSIEISDPKNFIKGKFEGIFPSGKSCATGAIFLIYEGNLYDLEKNEKPEEIQTSSSDVKLKDSTVADSVFTSNEVLFINEWDNGLNIELWDGDVQDNDEIAVYVNDKLHRGKLILKHKKTIIKLPAHENKFKLKIVAVSEGQKGKNTVKFKLNNVRLNKVYNSELSKGESFEIEFNKE